ncbi:hypothetical protein [Actinoplanes couchii]|uniref:ABC transporter n=1 Tax=Actinoplanes couchii TaxID=403638 RepID=A0ABQ3XD23_9ACTN|nr:hypothetical protein [Actinoplanes couchii]MDR6321273.1 hypothetical protein [Actinoplanes couchii]GID56384.1 hypothetical protein Aco03nite_047880 [Actinoplanes couchii]
MVALIRYQLAAVVHGQRYVAPLLFFGIVLTVFTVNDGGLLTNTYVVSASTLLISMCWLTVTIVNHEDPVRRSIQSVTAGGAGRVLAAEMLLALLSGVVLLGFGLAFPILLGQHRWGGADLAAGALAQLNCAVTGIAIGVVCSRLVVPRPGWSLLLALVVVIAVPLIPGLPPVNPVLTMMSGTRPAAEMLPTLTVHLAVSILVAAGCVALTRHVASRHD